MSTPHRLGNSLTASILLGKAAATGDMQLLSQLIDGILVEPRPDASAALSTAAGRGDLGMVEALLPFYLHGHDNSAALRAACASGCQPLVQRLTGVSNEVDFMSCVEEAAHSGHIEAVQALLSGRQDDATDALKKAASKGHARIVEFLIPFADPKRQNSAALCAACTGGHIDAVSLLLPVSDASDFDFAMACTVVNHHKEAALLFHERCDLSAVRTILSKNRQASDNGLLEQLVALKQASDLSLHTQQASQTDGRTRRL